MNTAPHHRLTPAPEPTVLERLAALDANFNDWFAGRIDHPTYTARHAAIWDAIDAAGLRADVDAAMVADERDDSAEWRAHELAHAAGAV